jgi:N-acetylneuraminate synthase
LNNLKSVYVIAEIGINHNGDVQLAKELIDKSHEAGANAVKFQKRDINLVYTKQELDKYRESPWGTTNRQQKEGLEFSIQQYIELESYTNNLGLDFIISCWDIASVDLVEEHLNIKYHKIASALATNREFLKKINSTARAVILSTGMCTEKQIAAAVELLDNVDIILACTSTYPTAASEINLRHIQTLKIDYPDIEIGFSNHYNGADACVGAAALGAACVEFHITNNRTAYGSDQAASIQSASKVVDAIRKMELMLGDGVKKVYDSEKPIAEKLRKKDDTTK